MSEHLPVHIAHKVPSSATNQKRTRHAPSLAYSALNAPGAPVALPHPFSSTGVGTTRAKRWLSYREASTSAAC